MRTGTRRRTTVAGAVLLGLAAALVPATALAAAKAPSSGVKNYAASPQGTVVPRPTTAGAPWVVTVTLINCGDCGRERSSNVPFGSAQLSFATASGLDAARATVRGREGWTVGAPVQAEGITTVQVISPARQDASVAPGSDLVVDLPVRPDAPDGRVDITTQVKQSNDFSGTGNDFSLVGAGQPWVQLGAGPPTSMAFAVGPSNVQSSDVAGLSSAFAPARSMCPPPVVQLLDAGGNPSRTQGRAVELRAATAEGAALALGGTTTAVTDAWGRATFGTCESGVTASQLGFDHRLRAVSAALPDAVAPGSFDVLTVYGRCSGTDACSTPLLGDGSTRAQLEALPGPGAGSAVLTFNVGRFSEWTEDDLASCDPDPGPRGVSPERGVVTVDLAAHSKTIQLRWSKRAVQWHTNNGASQWVVCFSADYPWPRLVAGEFRAPADDVAGQPWYTGALLPCSDARTAGWPCLQRLGRNGGEQVATVRVPEIEGDPRMI
jgi:hypothetical protein